MSKTRKEAMLAVMGPPSCCFLLFWTFFLLFEWRSSNGVSQLTTQPPDKWSTRAAWLSSGLAIGLVGDLAVSNRKVGRPGGSKALSGWCRGVPSRGLSRGRGGGSPAGGRVVWGAGAGGGGGARGLVRELRFVPQTWESFGRLRERVPEKNRKSSLRVVSGFYGHRQFVGVVRLWAPLSSVVRRMSGWGVGGGGRRRGHLASPPKKRILLCRKVIPLPWYGQASVLAW